MSGRTIAIDGRSFAWRALGEGPPLLLVNGYAASSADWDPALLAVLAHSFELICPDNRGTGVSELGAADALTVDAMAADLERLLDALELERAAVVGWSMGGYVSQRLALRAPARVTALTLLASAPAGPSGVLGEPAARRALVDHSGTPREQASRLISLLFPPAVAARVDSEFGEVVAAARSELSPQTLAAQERVLGEWHSQAQRAPGADAPPVLVICGGEDAVLPPANGEALAAFWPGARVVQIAGGGHAFMAQEPERVAHLIEAFVREAKHGGG
ncbi:MAG TPA: alpha/beta hydrolase [Solirubrobacteraceae bacterium]|jgi:pimeloyl-ACP methyl ester carboxylesterase|nr:alpha/beta hydrolase [Solirubrobacteraceae bacterium]